MGIGFHVDKSGIVSLPYGLEGICPARHMRKADGSNVQVDESNEFVIIEFNKDSRKIVVSHTKTFEEIEDNRPAAKGKTTGGNSGSKESSSVKKVNQTSEKSTLGDLDALTALKAKMEKGN